MKLIYNNLKQTKKGAFEKTPHVHPYFRPWCSFTNPYFLSSKKT